MLTKTPANAPAGRLGFVRMLRQMFAAIGEGRELATRYRILTNLSNDELAALGITRQDIPRVAVNGWKR